MGKMILPIFKCFLIHLSLVFLAYTISNYIPCEKIPVIQTKNGALQGAVAFSRNGRRYFQYLGIPYARPPVGNLRFEPPQPALGWEGILDASSYRAPCVGYDFFVFYDVEGEENCLFLNVMTPNVDPNRGKNLYPVIAYIHGGSYQGGSSNGYGGTYLMDENVVLVTLNYRLGIFGFFSTSDEVIRGNMGLKDQVMALKWIQANIENFGGDPNQVTIMGESVGGVSVQHLTLSPSAKNLFHRGISMSATSLLEFCHSNLQNMSRKAENAARHFGCPFDNSRNLAACLKEKDVSTLMTLRVQRNDAYYFNHIASFFPSKELDLPGAILTEKPLKLLQEGRVSSRVPWMVGINENEGLISLARSLQYSKTVNMIKDKALWKKTLRHLIFYDPETDPEFPDRVREYFFGTEKQSYELKVENPESIEIMSRLFTEKLFLKNMLDSAKLHSKVADVYLYNYSYRSFLTSFDFIRWATCESSIPVSLLLNYNLAADLLKRLFWPFGERQHFGASHGDQTLLLFDMGPVPSFFTNWWERDMSNLLVKTIADFANTKTVVRFQDLQWPKTDPLNVHIMDLNLGRPAVLENPYAERLSFWEALNLTMI